MWQNSRAERDKSILSRKCIFHSRKKRLSFVIFFSLCCWSSTSLDFFLSLSFCRSSSLWTPAAALFAFWCALPHCFWAFVYEKKETFICKESVKASSKEKKRKVKGLSEAVLSEKNLHSGHMPPHQLLLLSLLHCSDSSPSKHVSLLNEALSAFVGLSPQWSIRSLFFCFFLLSENAGWSQHCWMGQRWHGDVTKGGWHVVRPRLIAALLSNLGVEIPLIRKH